MLTAKLGTDVIGSTLVNEMGRIVGQVLLSEDTIQPGDALPGMLTITGNYDQTA